MGRCWRRNCKPCSSRLKKRLAAAAWGLTVSWEIYHFRANEAGHLDGEQQGGHFRAAGSGEDRFRLSVSSVAARPDAAGHEAAAQFGTGLFELRESLDRNAYRLVYVVNLRKAIYVLHAFMKKSKSRIGLPRPDAALIEMRLQRARALDAEE